MGPHMLRAAHTRHITPNQISGVITTLTISELKETRPAALQGGRTSFFVTQWGNLEHTLHPAKKTLIRKEGVLRYGNYREALDVKDDGVKRERDSHGSQLPWGESQAETGSQTSCEQEEIGYLKKKTPSNTNC